MQMDTTQKPPALLTPSEESPRKPTPMATQRAPHTTHAINQLPSLTPTAHVKPKPTHSRET